MPIPTFLQEATKFLGTWEGILEAFFTLKSFLETFFCVIFSPNPLEKDSSTWTPLYCPLTKVRLLNIWKDASAGPSAKVEHIPQNIFKGAPHTLPLPLRSGNQLTSYRIHGFPTAWRVGALRRGEPASGAASKVHVWSTGARASQPPARVKHSTYMPNTTRFIVTQQLRKKYFTKRRNNKHLSSR